MKSFEQGDYRALVTKTLLAGAAIGATVMGYVRYDAIIEARHIEQTNASLLGAMEHPAVPAQCKVLQDFSLTERSHSYDLTIKQPAECDAFKLPVYDLKDPINPVGALAGGSTVPVHCALYYPSSSVLETDSHGVPLAIHLSDAANNAHAAELQKAHQC